MLTFTLLIGAGGPGGMMALSAQDTKPDAGSSAPSAGYTPADTTAAAAGNANAMSALNDKTRLSNGDRISYQVLEEELKDPVLLTVSDSGELEIPLAGRITAAGKTCKELANEIKPILEKKYFYHATVIVGLDTLSTHPKGTVYLTGQVVRQGAVEIPPNEVLTVSKAILLDGGLSDFADRRKVKLVRKKADGTTTTTIVDLKEILDEGHPEKDPVLEPGDLISVPQRLFNY